MSALQPRRVSRNNWLKREHGFKDATARGQNPIRWIEYSFSSSVMIVVIAALAGVQDVGALIADFTGFGHPVSRQMATLFRRNWPPCFTGDGHPLVRSSTAPA